MSVSYVPILWNRQKKIYDCLMLLFMGLFLIIFIGLHLLLFPNRHLRFENELPYIGYTTLFFNTPVLVPSSSMLQTKSIEDVVNSDQNGASSR